MVLHSIFNLCIDNKNESERKSLRILGTKIANISAERCSEYKKIKEKLKKIFFFFLLILVWAQNHTKMGYLQYCSVLTDKGGVVAPSPRLLLAATQTWYRELGYSPSKVYWVTGGSKVLWLVN